MNVAQQFRKLAKVAVDNSPLILTAISVGGVVSTAILAGKGAVEARDAIFYENQMRGEGPYLTPKEELLFTWKCYIPATVTGCVTIACIIGAHTVGKRRQAALVSAYSVVETAFGEYREEVVKTLGKNKEEEVRSEVAKKHMEEHQPTVIVTGKGKVPFYDTMTGRAFTSDVETVRQAVNLVNKQIIDGWSATHNDFAELLGLDPTDFGSLFGWNADKLLEVDFGAFVHDNTPHMTIIYRTEPKENPGRIG